MNEKKIAKSIFCIIIAFWTAVQDCGFGRWLQLRSYTLSLAHAH